MAEPRKKVDESKATQPGKGLKGDAHDATYDKNGDLKIKSETPVAAVEGGERGSADTGVRAAIQEPVSGTTVNPVDTVDEDSMNEEARKASEPAKVEDKDGETHVDEAQLEQDEEAKEATLAAAGADDTEAAKAAEKSQAENKKEQNATDKK